MTTSYEIGIEAENAACKFLQDKGLRLEKRNYSCKQGEIDLIMYDQDVLVFVEVRKRKHGGYGTGFESVNASKRYKLTQAATQYQLDQNLYEKICCRFDIISFNWLLEPHWIQNAFEIDY